MIQIGKIAKCLSAIIVKYNNNTCTHILCNFQICFIAHSTCAYFIILREQHVFTI